MIETLGPICVGLLAAAAVLAIAAWLRPRDRPYEQDDEDGW